MSKAGTTAYGPRTFFCSFILILVLLCTANGQQKPKATWVDVDLSSRDGSTKATSTAPSPSRDPEKEKSIWREPAWYVALGGSALDIAGSIATIDGKHIGEGNAVFRRADGRLALTRALPVTAASLFLQYRAYKKHRKVAIAVMLATGILRGAFGGVRGFTMR